MSVKHTVIAAATALTAIFMSNKGMAQAEQERVQPQTQAQVYTNVSSDDVEKVVTATRRTEVNGRVTQIAIDKIGQGAVEHAVMTINDDGSASIETSEDAAGMRSPERAVLTYKDAGQAMYEMGKVADAPGLGVNGIKNAETVTVKTGSLTTFKLGG